MKRLMLLLLSAILAASCFSCAANTEEEKETGTPSAPVSAENAPETAETAPGEEERIAGPAAVDLNGYSFRILTSYWYNNDKIIVPEELTGEVINDAVFNANLSTMNTYNFVFSPVVLNDYPSVTPTVTASVKAGLDEYDMTLNHDNQTVSSALSGNHLNIRASDVFNFDAPWWTRTAEDFTVGGGMYFAANYTTYSPLYFGFALVYNKSLAEDYHIEIPYDKIIAGEWYLEDLIAMTKDVNRDLDGDGVMKIGVDQYGFMASTLGLVNFQVSLGNFMLGKDEDGYLVLDIDEDRLSRTLEAVERLMENGINKDDDPTLPWGYGTSFFAQGQVLFNYPQILDIPAQMHDTDVGYGTIPPPKLDETQKDYISGSFDIYWAIPKTAYRNLDTIATIIEGMAHNCFYDVLPAAYETTLQVRFSDSPNDARAFEIIRDSMCVDIGYAFNEKISGLNVLVRALSSMTSGTMASTVAKNQKVIVKQLDKMNNTFREMNAVDYTVAP